MPIQQTAASEAEGKALDANADWLLRAARKLSEPMTLGGHRDPEDNFSMPMMLVQGAMARLIADVVREAPPEARRFLVQDAVARTSYHLGLLASHFVMEPYPSGEDAYKSVQAPTID